MPKYLFRFGYCTPHQWKDNEEYGWDDESSDAFFVVAKNRKSAEVRGCEVVEVLCRKLFEKAEWNCEIPSWKNSGFAFWIEKDHNAIPEEFLKEYPVVQVGHQYDFTKWNPTGLAE